MGFFFPLCVRVYLCVCLLLFFCFFYTEIAEDARRRTHAQTSCLLWTATCLLTRHLHHFRRLIYLSSIRLYARRLIFPDVEAVSFLFFPCLLLHGTRNHLHSGSRKCDVDLKRRIKDSSIIGMCLCGGGGGGRQQQLLRPRD